MGQPLKRIMIVMFSWVMLCSSLYPQTAQAGEITTVYLPKPGTMVELTPAYDPSYLTGMVIDPNQPLKFDFLVHRGEGDLTPAQKEQEYNKLIKYFLASLTIPDDNQWVNLSPYEKDRIIESDFGKTEMGRDLLAQDYVLKQMASSLMYPESGSGKDFWSKVYAQAKNVSGSTDIPVSTFNKVWIVPSEVVVYEHNNDTASPPKVTAYVVKSHLKVMLEEDYLALQKHTAITAAPKNTRTVAAETIKEVILPILEKEINEGKNFAQLRQVVSGMILATWYKRSLKESLLGKVYADKAKVKGVDLLASMNGATEDPQRIYQQYLAAFKKGVYNYIKEDRDPMTDRLIPRKYFAGGFYNNLSNEAMTVTKVNDRAMITVIKGANDTVVVALNPTVQPIPAQEFEHNGAMEDNRAANDAKEAARQFNQFRVGQDNIVAPVPLDQLQEIVFPPYLSSYDSFKPVFLRIAIKGEPSDVVRLVYSRPEGLILFTMNKKDRSFEYLNNTQFNTVGLKEGIVASQRVKSDLISKDGIVFKISKIDLRNESNPEVYYKVSTLDPDKTLLIYNDERTPKLTSRQAIEALEAFSEERLETRERLQEMLDRGPSVFGELSTASVNRSNTTVASTMYRVQAVGGRRYIGQLIKRVNSLSVPFKDRIYSIKIMAVHQNDLGFPVIVSKLLRAGVLVESNTSNYVALGNLDKLNDLEKRLSTDEMGIVESLLLDFMSGDEGKYIRVKKIESVDYDISLLNVQDANPKNIDPGVLYVPDIKEAFGPNVVKNIMYVLAGNRIFQVYRNKGYGNTLEQRGRYDTVMFKEIFTDGSISSEPIYVPVNGRMTESGLQCRFQEEGAVYVTYKDQPVEVLTLKAEEMVEPTDQAMAKGGIDLNAANMDITIRRDSKGIVLPFAAEDIARFSTIGGFVPNIIDIKPFNAALFFNP